MAGVKRGEHEVCICLGHGLDRAVDRKRRQIVWHTNLSERGLSIDITEFDVALHIAKFGATPSIEPCLIGVASRLVNGLLHLTLCPHSRFVGLTTKPRTFLLCFTLGAIANLVSLTTKPTSVAPDVVPSTALAIPIRITVARLTAFELDVAARLSRPRCTI